MTRGDKVSALAPVSAEYQYSEQEKSSSWLGRQAAQSLTGRVVMSTYESLKTAGTVVCLSPWGDSSPLIMPSVRFRDLLIESVMAATGGTAAIAAPALDPLSDTIASSLGDTVTAQLVTDVGMDVVTGYADDKLIEGPIEDAMPDYDFRKVESTGVKTIMISLQYKHVTTDAALGFYRSSVHQDSSPNSMFSNVKDYLGTQKGWFSPYLFASGRRPVIPRSMVPDVVFCHGPFLSGDYKVGQALLAETAHVASFAKGWSGVPPSAAECDPEGQGKPSAASKIMGGVRKWGGKVTDGEDTDGTATDGTDGADATDDKMMKNLSKEDKKAAKAAAKEQKKAQKAAEKEAKAKAKADAKAAEADESASKEEAKADRAAQEDAQEAVPPTPRQIAVFALGIKPHRGKMWTTSQRPSESVVQYQLLNGLPVLVVPGKVGAPLLAWDAANLVDLHKLSVESADFEKHVDALLEFLDMCVDWERVGGGQLGAGAEEKEKKDKVRNELRVIVAGAVRSGENKQVKKALDPERAGVVLLHNQDISVLRA